MLARLLAVAGPLSDRSFALGTEELLLGRDVACTLRLADAQVSRRHCLVRPDGDGWVVIDLSSRHGTLVNGAAVTSAALGHGDRVSVGGSAFLFLDGDAAVEDRSGSIELEDTEPLTGASVSIPIEGRETAASAGSGGAARLDRDLDVVLRVATLLGSERELDALARRLIGLVLEVIPAERGGLMLVRPGSDELDAILARGLGVDAGRPLRASRTVVNKVLGERVALRSNEARQEPGLDVAESIQAGGVRSVLCVPLVLYGRALGVLYVDSGEARGQFDDGHLRLATAISGIAAVAIDSLRRLDRLQTENRYLRNATDFGAAIVGEAAAMKAVLGFIARVAPTDSTVLVSGETGTGKEVVARALHDGSRRAAGPFVAVNCATLGESLIESEVFGHEKGAFTGASALKKGRMELAHGGTLFLDEVGELPLALQPKLLRALQERSFERVGGTRPVAVDIRVIAATNRNLEAASREGRFRQDLYYRLNVIAVDLPPLRDRREDVLLLAERFLKLQAARHGRPQVGLSSEARSALLGYDWPGNVRELQNAIERAVVLGTGDVLAAEDLPEAVTEACGRDASASATPDGARALPYHEAVNAAKRDIVRRALDDSHGTVTEAARRLGLNPNYLHRLMTNLGLRAGDLR